jgi:hypothetical protein
MNNFENQIIIDEEFKSLLPELDKETYSALEENMLQHGCRDASILWDGVLIDGHNRYQICLKHDIPFDTIDLEFESREAVTIRIISNQVSRHNMSAIQLFHYRGLHYRMEKKIRCAYSWEEIKKVQNEPFKSGTAESLAEQYNVSRSTSGKFFIQG